MKKKNETACPVVSMLKEKWEQACNARDARNGYWVSDGVGGTNNYWTANGMPNPYEGMTDEERLAAGCMQMASTVVVCVVALLLCALIGGCSTKTVAVPVVHERWLHTVDTMTVTDSVVERETTIVREVDSSTLAQYGVTIASMQRAWLVEKSQLLQQKSAVRSTHTDTVHLRDSIPVPVQTIKEMPVQLSWHQKAFMETGKMAIFALIIWLFLKIRLSLRPKT